MASPIDELGIYAITLSAPITILLVVQLARHLIELFQCLEWSQKLCRVYDILAHRVFYDLSWLGAWTWLDVLIQVVFFAANASVLLVRRQHGSDLAQDAGRLALVNVGPFYMSLSLAYLANMLGIRLRTVRIYHRAPTLTVCILAIIHVCISLRRTSVEVVGLVSLSCLVISILVRLRPLKRLSYEVSLRAHQLLALGAGGTLWLHTKASPAFLRRFIMATAIILTSTTIAYALRIALLHHFFIHGLPTIVCERIGPSILVKYHSRYLFDINAGQYVYLWVPGLSLSSFLQSHPFVVTSVRKNGHEMDVVMVVLPHRGWTLKLANAPFEEVRNGDEKGNGVSKPIERRAVLGGPHGISVPVNDYGTVIMIASDLKLVALLPYLRHTIMARLTRSTKTQHIHLIWQLEEETEHGSTLQLVLNEALWQDKEDKAYVTTLKRVFDRILTTMQNLKISIYAPIILNIDHKGAHDRVFYYPPCANWNKIIHEDLTGLGTPETAFHQTPGKHLILCKLSPCNRCATLIYSASGSKRRNMQTGEASRRRPERRAQIRNSAY